MKLYLIGSLRNPKVTEIGNSLRLDGHDVFDDWMAAGPEADDYWQKYEQSRGHTYVEALQGYAAEHVFYFDLEHLKAAEAGILIMPAGKSAFMEAGWLLGQGKKVYVLMEEEPARYDVMLRFATGAFNTLEELQDELKRDI